MGEFAIQTEDLTRTFGAVCAVDRLNLAVPYGTTFGIIGPRTAGKTTTIRLLLGLLPPTSGTATVLGYDVATQSNAIRQHTGALLAEAGLYERLTAHENLDYFGRIWHMGGSDRRARSRTLLTRLGLWELRDLPVGTLDEPARRRLSLARALFHHPTVLFLDEPTAHLDHADAVALRQDLAQLMSHEGVTAILTTSSLVEAEALCTTLAVMRRGHLVADGALAELRRRRGIPLVEMVGHGFTDSVLALINRRPEVARSRRVDNRLLLQLTDDVPIAPLISLLVESGVDLEEVRKNPADMQSLLVEFLQEEGLP
jgi:ABC-2 type transport system ATP-binding protein